MNVQSQIIAQFAKMDTLFKTVSVFHAKMLCLDVVNVTQVQVVKVVHQVLI